MCLAPHTQLQTGSVNTMIDISRRQAWTGRYSIFFLLCITVDLTPPPSQPNVKDIHLILGNSNTG